MKKIVKQSLLVFGLGVIVFTSTGTEALTLYADDIIYNPSNTEFKVDNAQSALDELYNMVTSNENSTAQLVEISSSRNFNITDIVGTEYLDKYSVNDFVVVGSIPATTGYGEVRDLTGAKGYGTVSEETDFTVSYNETTGDVTITGGTLLLRAGVIKSSGSASGSLNTTVTKNVKVYMLIKTPNANI